MSAPAVRIRIGGAIDSSLATSLRSAAQMVGQAERSIQQRKRETTKAAESEARKQLKAEQELARAAESLSRQRSAALFQQYRQREAAAARSARAEEQAVKRTQEAARREIEKTVQAAVRAADREQRVQQRAQARARDRFATRTSHRASRFLMPEAPIGPMVMRGLGQIAQGAGVDFSIAGAVGRTMSLQQQAIDLSNSGFQQGAEGPNGQRVDPAVLTAQARAVGGQYGIDASEVLGGLAQFQKIAGDLNAGRETLVDMARLSKATGTNFEELAAATASVSNGLGDVPDKARLIDEVMRTIAGQGKLGAVEISDMAVQMARVAAAASNFSGDRATNIQQMGALMQIARAEGGAPSAAEAARSVGGFANTMKKGARISAFRKQGIDVFADESHTSLKDPIQLIKESLVATGGDLEKMNKLFMDVVGARTVSGLQKTFTGAGGGQAGLNAVDAQIQRMLKAQMTRAQVEEDAARAAASMKSKAVQFQNELDRIHEAAIGKLLPALTKLERPILSVAETLSSLAVSAAEHPWTAVGVAIGGAITASVLRAGLESVLRASLEKALIGSPMPFGAGGVGGGGLVAGGGRLAAGARLMTNGLFGAAVGGMAGAAIGDAAGDTAMGATIGGGAGAGLMMGGPLGALAGGAWGAAIDQARKLHDEAGGWDFWNYEENLNAQAKARAKAEEAEVAKNQINVGAIGAPSPAAGGGGSMVVQQLQQQNEQLQRELQQSRLVQQQMLRELQRLNIPVPTDGAPPPRVSQ